MYVSLNYLQSHTSENEKVFIILAFIEISSNWNINECSMKKKLISWSYVPCSLEVLSFYFQIIFFITSRIMHETWISITLMMNVINYNLVL